MDTAANGSTPYSQEQILTIAYNAMYQTGLYNEKFFAWEDLTNTQRTLANVTLASQIRKLTENTTKHKEELDSMKTNIADILSLLQDTTVCPRNNYRGGQGNQGGCGGHGNYQQRSQNRQQHNAPTVHYCWSHGVTGSNYHASTNCENRKSRHRENAMTLNPMGRHHKQLRMTVRGGKTWD
eukprot:1043269-Ditylum_brightwellii.AAC.1